MLNQPRKSKELKQLETLNRRITLSAIEQQQLSRLEAGNEGERLLFNLLKEELGPDVASLFDFYLHSNGSICQIDCLLLFQTKAFLFEVKHFAGDYFIKDNNWYTLKQMEIKNPLHQLKRTELLVSALFQKHRMQIDLQSFVIFTHPEFFLYEAPRNLPVIFPAQLKRYLKSLRNLPRRLSTAHQNFITEVFAQQKEENPFQQPLNFNFDQIKKGILCESCSRFMTTCLGRSMFCHHCEKREPIELSIKRSIEEFQILFPREKITVKRIAEWIDDQGSDYYIRKVLDEGWRVIKKNRYTYYISKTK